MTLLGCVGFALLFMGNIIFFLLWRDEIRFRKTDKEYYESSLKNEHEAYEVACKRAEDYAGKLGVAQRELLVSRGRMKFIDALVKVFQKYGVRV